MLVLFFFCLPGKAADTALSSQAVEWAKRLLATETATVQHYDTYWNPDGTPHAELFLCQPARASDTRSLTLALSPGGSKSSVLFYYFAEPFDRQFRTTAADRSASRVIVSPAGLLLRTGDTTRRIPQAPGPGDEVLPAAAPLPAGTPSPLDSGDDEMIIPGVPNYLWYLNCALTSETMVLGYWNDHGCAGLVPGGNSSQGCYYAITEELMWLRDDRVKRYATATELGYSWRVTQSALPNLQWATYVAAIQTAPGPLLVTWSGPPYGAHSTVGVGYQAAGTNRFLVLHDTWVSTPAYVNYDTYRTSIVTIAITSLDPACTNPPPSTNAVPLLSYGIALSPTNFSFSPALSFSAYSYHTFEGGDFNRDGLMDLVVGNFRNNVASAVCLALYTNSNGRFTRDSSFSPTLDWYECVHVARACDFDGDGDVDLAVSGYWMPTRIYLNTGTGLTNQAIVLGNEYSTYGYSDLAWGDIDGDGDSDLVTCIANPYPMEGKIRIYRWQGGAFQPAGATGLANDWYSALKLCDLNNDHRPEIVCANRRGSVVAFLNSNGQFTNSPFLLPAPGHGALALDVADTDADGFPEIVTVDDGRIVLFDNGAGGLSTAPQYLDASLRMYARDLRLADLNRDGFPELLVANHNTRTAIFLNRGGTFETKPLWLSPRVETAVRIHVYESGDADGTILGFAKARGGTAEFYRVQNLPVFSAIKPVAGAPVLSLENLLPGKTYAIESTAQLDSREWSEGQRFQSASSKTNWTDSGSGTDPQRFYRVRRLE